MTITKTIRPFHLALPVASLKEAIEFYHEKLGFPLGRQDTHWVDFNFYGHQVVFHEVKGSLELHHNPVDKHDVPVPHFGIILEKDDWEKLGQKLKDLQVEFTIEPHIRFEGQAGEQGTFFFYDPNGLALEFKTFKSDSMIFSTINNQ